MRRKPKSNGAASSAQVPVLTTGDYQVLPLSSIQPKEKWNPRTLFADAEMRELAEDIRVNGIIQPLVVRRAGSKLHVIAGERRYRAAKLLGLVEVPVIVRELDDRQAFRQTMSENINRVALHPIEETDGFARMQQEHRMTPGEIAAETGKTVQYVLNRLQLAVLGPKVREIAFEMGDRLPIGYLQVLAQVGSHELQHEMLRKILKPPYGDGMLNLKQAQELLEGYQVTLSKAQFKPTDPTLDEQAGSCADCPQNTRNLPREIFAMADICTNLVCYRAKQKAAFVKLAAEKQSEIEIIPDSKAKSVFAKGYSEPGLPYSSAFVDIDSTRNDYDGTRPKTWRKWFSMFGGEYTPKLYLGFNPYLHRWYYLAKRSEAQAAVEKIRRKQHPEKTQKELTMSGRDLAEERRRKREKKALDMTAREVIEQIVSRVAESPERSLVALIGAFDSFEYQQEAMAVAKRRGIELTEAEQKKESWNQRRLYAEKLFESAKSMNVMEALGICLEIGLSRNSTDSYGNKLGKPLARACELFGIDAEARRKEIIDELKAKEKEKQKKATKSKAAKGNEI